MADNPPALSDADKEFALAYANAQRGGAGNSVSAPASQRWILMPLDPKKGVPPEGAPNVPTPPGFAWYENPGYTAPKATAASQPQTYGNSDVGYWTVDASDPKNPVAKQLVPPHTPNADDEISKALKREQDEQLRVQRQNNAAAGFGYADDDTVAKRSLEARAAGVADKDIELKYRAQDEAKRQFDIKQKVEDAKASQDIKQSQAQVGLIGSQTGRTGAETAQIQQNVDIAQKKLPYELEQLGATKLGTEASTALTKAQIDKYTQDLLQGKAPTVQTPPTGMSQWSRNPDTGAVTQGAMNPEWLAKTQSEIAARVGQIQTLANAKKAEVMGKVSETFTPDMALQEFNSWYDQQVQPQIGSLQAAQQAAQIEQQKAVMGMRGTAMTQALGAGDQAQRAYDSYVKTNAGPRYEDVMSQITSGKPASQIDMHGVSTFQGPNVLDYVQQGTQNALKYIDPTMAQGAGAPPPNFQGIDIAGALGRDKYMPAWLSGGAPPPPATGSGWDAVQQIPNMVGSATPQPIPNAGVPPPLLPAGVAGTAADPRFANMYGAAPYVPRGANNGLIYE